MATREIVGWIMADHLRADLACDALLMAIRHRQPPRGLIQHSDRGVQYASEPYQAILARHGLRCSMSRRGNCLDNAPMESFFGSLKTEHVHRARFRTREEAKAAVFDYVEIWTSPLGVEGSLTNPITPGGRHGGEADPAAVHR